MPKAKRKQPTISEPTFEPTREQFAKGEFQQGGKWATAMNDRAGLAFRRVPVIDTMRERGQISEQQWASLAYSRDQATRAEDDVAQSSTLAPDRVMGGRGAPVHSGPIPVVLLATPAILETARIERDLGQLLGIARAIAVDDVSLSQWCVQRHGGRERYNGKGKLVAIVPNRERETMKLALLELKFAAGRIVR